ncbi:MAG: hypothetical protein JXN62_08975 [Bacteroidales bacterium]|nr:hypothetical protein [Bacteroidales bacterium]
MAGIAGIAEKGAKKKVRKMLGKISYRGKAGITVFESEGTTLGMVWNDNEYVTSGKHIARRSVGYENGPGHCAKVRSKAGKLIMYRDELGVAPLYYGRDDSGNMCFSSEVKSLLSVTNEISEMPAGHISDGEDLECHYTLKTENHSDDNPERIADDLRKHLDNAVSACLTSDDIGSWLSGGLDSSAICALASEKVKKLKTFTAGLREAPDIISAREMARYIRSDHHEIIVTKDDMISVLPEVIYHLESFDALLVRSAITNYFVARLASDHVSGVFSGEGGDELFAGYDYLKKIPRIQLENELEKITGQLHNTALQRVDRCASAHGTTVYTIFTNPEIVNFAFTIPVRYKLYNNVEKWILRKALEGLLPKHIAKRPKAKFWEGAGTRELISDYTEKMITDSDFKRERYLANDLIINTKEELYYYRLFKEHFGSDIDISWMGRTSI